MDEDRELDQFEYDPFHDSDYLYDQWREQQNEIYS